MTDNEIVKILKELYKEQILDVDEFPKAYNPGGILNVKAIYLGCDPSNRHSKTLPYAFALESNIKKFEHFIFEHTKQLKQIELNWNSVYTQNLCRNYFKDETYKNPIWKNAAQEFWIGSLIDELQQFDQNIPVLLTSQILLEVLGIDGFEKKLAPDFYECRIPIPIPPSKNKLNRNLIPVYRGKSSRYEVSYHLKNIKWNKYRESIIEYFKQRNLC